MYTGLAVATTLAGILFWLLFRRYNDKEDSMNALAEQGTEEDKAIPANQVEVVRNPET